jgi:plasmid maintenance system killer protein
MDVTFSTKKFHKICSSDQNMRAEYGDKMAKKLQQRLLELKAVNTLADIRLLPGPRCHEHTGNNKGILTVDLIHPYRLYFKPNHDPVPTKPDGGLDWKIVTSILVLQVGDPH